LSQAAPHIAALANRPRLVKTETGCRPDSYFGEWAIEPERVKSYWEVVRSADLTALAAAKPADLPPAPLYTARDGVAIVPLSGPMTKYQTSFQSLVGGTSTVQTRQAIRAANADPSVRAVLLHIESPGGTASGTQELYDAISGSRKKVYAYVEDLGASAALWAASAADTVYANRSAQIGSIGTFVTIQDTSGAYAKEGVKVHVISSGGVKGGGADGVPVTDAYLAEAQKRVDAITEQFVEAVAAGRARAGMTPAKVRELADGRMHTAPAAKSLGLIDRIASFDDALLQIARKSMDENAQTALAVEVAELRAKLEKAEADNKSAQEALAKVEAEKKLTATKASLAALKNLPAQKGLAEALVQIEAAAPEAFAALMQQISAWDETAKVAAAFSEAGSSAPSAVPSKVNVNDPEAFRKAADELVAAGKHKDRADAMKAILRAQESN